jgi:hypothetical protein
MTGEWRGKGAFHPDAIGHLADGKARRLKLGSANHDAFKGLDALLLSLDDPTWT